MPWNRPGMSEQNDEGEHAQKNERDQAGPHTGHQLTPRVDVRRRLPLRRRGRTGAVWMRRHLQAPDQHVQLPTPVRSITTDVVTPIITPMRGVDEIGLPGQQRLARQSISLEAKPPVDHCSITAPGYPQRCQGNTQTEKLRGLSRRWRPVDEPVEIVDSRTLLLDVCRQMAASSMRA